MCVVCVDTLAVPVDTNDMTPVFIYDIFRAQFFYNMLSVVVALCILVFLILYYLFNLRIDISPLGAIYNKTRIRDSSELSY